MVPQYKPESVLILGYAGGTVASLIRLLYGYIRIIGVDIEPGDCIQADAREYVKSCSKFDTVVVDLFKDGKICDFVCTREFVDDVSKIANYVIINTLGEPDMSVWKSLKYVGMNKPNRCSNLIYYYRTTDIPDLLP